MQDKACSSYYPEDEFNSMFIQRNIKNNVSVSHVNARRLHKNLDYLQMYLRTLKHNFSVIAVSETRASNDCVSLLNIPGYYSTFKNRFSGGGAGVALFVRNCFKFTIHDDLSVINNDNFESIFIELSNSISGNRISGAVCRLPGYSPDLVMNGFVKVLSVISKTRTECLIAGDFNIDLLMYDENADTEDCINNLTKIYLSHLYLDQYYLI